jgi:hypothetical protein
MRWVGSKWRTLSFKNWCFSGAWVLGFGAFGDQPVVGAQLAATKHQIHLASSEIYLQLALGSQMCGPVVMVIAATPMQSVSETHPCDRKIAKD